MQTLHLTFDEDADRDERAASAGGFVLAHLSDPHLSSLRAVAPRDLLNKRMFGYLSWLRRRRREHRVEVLDALLEDLRTQRPDHLAITGDLTHIGLPAECREAAAWLARTGNPRDVTVIPGNHDTYVAQPWATTLGLWSDWMRGDQAGAADAESMFPSLRIRGDVALIGLSTAVPSALFLATGRIGARQLQQLDRILEQTGRQQLFRVVLLHHPPAAWTVSWRKSLLDHAALREVLDRRGAELLLYGHTHFPAADYVDAAGRRHLALGVPSASALTHRPERIAAYHLYRIARSENGWRLRVSVRAYARARGVFIAASGRHLRAALEPA